MLTINILDFFKAGGIFMFPILGVFIIGFAIFVERYFYLSSCNLKNRKFLNVVDSKEVPLSEAIASSNSIMAKIWKPVFSDIALDKNRLQEVEALNVEANYSIGRRTQGIALFANVATLLGLLGTIVGLISSFASIADVSAVEKASVLSTSISVAMNTTAAGLIASVPLLVLHYIVQSKSDKIETQCIAFNKRVYGILNEA